MGHLRFSGHDSFQCRNVWLKKGFDFINNGQEIKFSDDQAVITLGVGKNMTTAIRYWLDSFGLRNKETKITTPIAGRLLNPNGWDPYLEDIGTLWLLHYLLVSNNHASIYHIIFNKFRKHKIEFTKEQLVDYLINYSEEQGESHSANTIETDVSVFLQTYVQPKLKGKKNNIEDLFSALLIELNLVRKIDNVGSEIKEQWYEIESSDRESLPLEIFYFSILNNIDNGIYSQSISLHKLLNEDNSPASIFAIHPDALVSKVEELARKFVGVTYKEDGGIRELQIGSELDKYDALETYYDRN